MDNSTTMPTLAPDDNASARDFARTLSEEDLFQYSRGHFVPMFAYPPDQPTVWVKFGRQEKEAEGDMQRLAYNWLRQEHQRVKCNIHVPEVFKIFSRGDRTFVIMQLVQALFLQDFAQQFGVEKWEDENHKAALYDMIVEGIQLLCSIPVPTDATPGPYTSVRRRINHMLFKDQHAPLVYNTVEELESHLNKVAEIGYRRHPNPPNPSTVTLEKDLVFCYTDFNDENFMFTTDTDGRPHLYMLDFEHASFLPISFLSYAVLGHASQRWITSPWIRDKIGDSLPRDNLTVMERIFYMFQISTWTIGLTDRQYREIRGEDDDEAEE